MECRTVRRVHCGSSFLFSFIMIASGVADIIHVPGNVAIFIHLGYPLYVLTMIGVAKLLGSLAILCGRPLALKEWAYAGFTFDLVGALISHAVIGDRPQLILPALLLILMVVSYVAWKRSVPSAAQKRTARDMKTMSRLAVLLVLLADGVAFGTSTGRAHWIDEALALACLFFFGLVFILVILIPRWRRLEPKVYLGTFAAFLPLAGALLPLLGASEFALTFGALDRQWYEPGVPLSLCVAIVGIVGVLVPSVVINVPINMKVLRRPDSLLVSEIVDLRKRWATGHAARTGFGLVALLALVAARARLAH